MGFLRRVLGGGDQPVPEWAAFFSPGEYRAFMDAVDGDLRRRGFRVEYGDGVALAARGDDAEPQQFGLSNLAQVCHAEGRDDWSRVIAMHFSNLLATMGRDLDALAADYDQARPVLRVRLLPDESMAGVPLPEAVTRPIAPGILGVLVFDFPDSTASVHRDHLAGWPVDVDGAFAQGLANLDGEPMPVREDVDQDEVRFTLWLGDSFYVATRVLRLGDLLPPGATDAVVAVPNRHVLLVHAMVDGSVVPSLQAIYSATASLFRDGPGSISDQPYWWHEGALTMIPHRMERDRVIVTPPEDFVHRIEAIIGGPPDAAG
jgi:hypothetical protein